MIEVIKVIDFTDVFVRMKEILYIKVFNCSKEDKVELFQIAETFKAKVIDYGKDSLLLEFVQTATKNDAVVKLIKEGRIVALFLMLSPPFTYGSSIFSFFICAFAFRPIRALLFIILARVILSFPNFIRISSIAASSFLWRSLFSVSSNRDICS